MDKEKLIKALQFKAVRSSGAGGQNVNKVASKVELSLDLNNAEGLTVAERERLLLKLAPRLTKAGVLHLYSEASRSQYRNKQLVVKRLFEVLEKALYLPKKRKMTKPTKASVEKRLLSKNKTAAKKVNRRKPNLD